MEITDRPKKPGAAPSKDANDERTKQQQRQQSHKRKKNEMSRRKKKKIEEGGDMKMPKKILRKNFSAQENER